MKTKTAAWILSFALLLNLSAPADAATPLALNEQVDLTLKMLYEQIPGAD